MSIVLEPSSPTSDPRGLSDADVASALRAALAQHGGAVAEDADLCRRVLQDPLAASPDVLAAVVATVDADAPRRMALGEDLDARGPLVALAHLMGFASGVEPAEVDRAIRCWALAGAVETLAPRPSDAPAEPAPAAVRRVVVAPALFSPVAASRAVADQRSALRPAGLLGLVRWHPRGVARGAVLATLSIVCLATCVAAITRPQSADDTGTAVALAASGAPAPALQPVAQAAATVAASAAPSSPLDAFGVRTVVTSLGVGTMLAAASPVATVVRGSTAASPAALVVTAAGGVVAIEPAPGASAGGTTTVVAVSPTATAAPPVASGSAVPTTPAWMSPSPTSAPTSSAPGGSSAPATTAPVASAAPISSAPAASTAPTTSAPAASAPASSAPAASSAPVSSAPAASTAPSSSAQPTASSPVSSAPSASAPASSSAPVASEAPSASSAPSAIPLPSVTVGGTAVPTDLPSVVPSL